MGWALHQGPKCLLIKSQLRLEPALPPPPHPRGRHTQPFSSQPPGMHLHSAHSIRGKHSRERQEDIPAQHKGPASSAGPGTGGCIPLLDNKGDMQAPRNPPTPPPAGCWVKLVAPLSCSFLLCPAGLVPVSDPPAFSEMRLLGLQCHAWQRARAPPRLVA